MRIDKKLKYQIKEEDLKVGKLIVTKYDGIMYCDLILKVDLLERRVDILEMKKSDKMRILLNWVTPQAYVRKNDTRTVKIY